MPAHPPSYKTYKYIMEVREGELSKRKGEKEKKKRGKNSQAFNIYIRMKCFINYIQNQFAAIFLKFLSQTHRFEAL